MDYHDALQEIRDVDDGEKRLTTKQLESIKEHLNDYDIKTK